MDREEAIATLEDIKQFGIGKWMFDKEEIEAFDMAIEAMQAKTDGDIISRQDALMEARPEYLNPSQQGHESYNQGWNDAVDEYYGGIKSLPSAEPKTGEWISNRSGYWKCSECGIRVAIYGKGNYCPNCGAKMVANIT